MLRDKSSLLTLTYLGALKNVPNYNTMGLAKASLEASVRYLAGSVGPKGIRVNAVCPGFIATEMVKAMPENILQDIERRSWLGRLGTPEEMANVYLFLASDEASYVNGVALEASGGISL